MDKVGVGLIGAGMMGSWGHYPGYAEIPDKAKMVAVCDKEPSALNDLAERSGAKPYTDYQELLKDPKVDAVDICLPHFLHGRVALAALEAGKHVIVEKPFTMTLSEADQVIAAAKRTGLKLMVAENMRFVNAYEVTKALVEKGEIGDICYARAYTGGPNGPLDPENWRSKPEEAGGGTMMDDGVHCFDMFRWMVGDVKSVFAITNRFNKDSSKTVEDNAVGTVRFKNGAMGIYAFSTTTMSPWTEQLELYGTEGAIIVDFLSHQPVRVLSAKRAINEVDEQWSQYGNIAWQEPFIEHSVERWATLAMRKEVKYFVDCILENTEPRVTGEDGKKAVELVLKAYESAKLGKEVEI